MADLFTGPEKITIRAVLGYPNLFRYKNTRLESALVAVDDDGAAYVRAELARVVEIDTAIASGGTAFDALGLKKVDEIEFQNGANQGPAEQAKRMGRIHIGRISAFFGVPTWSDYYGQGGFPGDFWSDGINQQSRGLGFEIKLG